jgi:hypothetical protein
MGSMWIGVLYALAAASAGTVAGSWAPWPWAWPLVMTAAIYPLFALGVRSGALGRTVSLMLVWAVGASMTMLLMVRAAGLEIGASVINGPAYAAEMMHWVETGVGAEGSPSLFLPVHARHYAAFLIGSTLTGGFAGLYFGTILLNYMNVYVATLAAHAEVPALAYAIGWPVWAVVRVVGYVAAGTALAHLGYTRVLKRGEWNGAAFRRWMLVSIALVLLDVVLKASLAETWRGFLGRAMG